MTLEAVATLAQALLYEGYLLYPYRRSSVKNRHRWMFGTLYPHAFAEAQNEADPWWMQSQCLVEGSAGTEVETRVRFLHLTPPEAVEREVDPPVRPLGRLCTAPETTAFAFQEGEETCGVRGTATVAAERAGDGLFTVTVRVENVTPFTTRPTDARAARRDAALPHALASAHAILAVHGGAFVSLVDPPDRVRDAAARCRNVGVWPVLVGAADARDTVLAAPIILADYPRVAPESPGDFFDATEIDEMLTLRVLTLTDDEKTAMRGGDARAQALLARTESLDEETRRRLVHGASRSLRAGTRVRLTPRRGGDIFDLALAGRTATIVKVEVDYEGEVFVAVAVDDDPGRDLGVDGRPGHRFFFRPDEVEVLP
jgi:hypothetical protein